MSGRIRTALRSDLPELVRIYNHYVCETPVTFDTEPFSEAMRLPWFEDFSASGPHRLLVADDGGRAVGYASSRVFRPKAAYDRTVETTIYLDAQHTGQGLGRELYAALLDLMGAEPDVHRAVAGITLPNAASVALHRALGFEEMGTFHEVGFKFDRYWDVQWFQRGM